MLLILSNARFENCWFAPKRGIHFPDFISNSCFQGMGRIGVRDGLSVFGQAKTFDRPSPEPLVPIFILCLNASDEAVTHAPISTRGIVNSGFLK